MSSNFQSIADWRPPESLPRSTPGRYLVILRHDEKEDGKRRPDEMHVYNVMQGNGCFIRTVGGYFEWDRIHDGVRLVAWADAPALPEWLDDNDS